MKKLYANSVFALLIAANAVFAAQTDNEAERSPNLEESREIAREFMRKLGGTLKKQLESGGADMAISVCKHVAPALAAEYSKDGWQVSRVSLKTRNKILGTPDAWEREVLKTFGQARKNSKAIAAVEVADVVGEADGRWFRYMKAIPTQPMCLQCHGKPDELPAGVKAILAREYPEDRATGYSVGDIRGAISIKRKLPDAKY